ncbi:MAG: PilZ domain-containing protein [Betaproteobacteria bacterium]
MRDNEPMRKFIRHPTAIPIEVGNADHVAGTEPQFVNVSHGGLAFQSDVELAPGLIVEVRIPSMFPMFTTLGRVVWCKAVEQRYQLGVAFLDQDDAFRTRMVEQICHIETYRKNVSLTEGRKLSAEEAATEWIDKFAAKFPDTSSNVKN